MDSNENRESGHDRRSFLQSLAAASAAGALGTGVASGDSNESTTAVGEYHQWLRSYLTEDEGLPQGEFVYATTEAGALDAFALQGGDQGTEFGVDVSADDVPLTSSSAFTRRNPER